MMNDSQSSNIAIIANSQTPYRLHLHMRIAREIQEICLWSLFTHETSAGADWTFSAPQEINPISFGKGESSSKQASLRHALREWSKGRQVIKWLKAHRIRAVVVNGYNDFGRIRIILWCNRAGIPCFLFGDSNIRGDKATGLKAFIKRQWVSRVVSHCSGILPCGTLGQAYFERYGADPARIFFSPYEPDYDLIRALPSEMIEQTRRRFNLNTDRRRIVFSGRLVDAKRPDLLIDAFAAIATKRPDWDLLMVGAGALKDSLKLRLPAALQNRVIWTGFLDDQAVVSALYRLSDVLVLPSDYEPWALVVNEAAAAGLAIVASNVVGAAAELVRENFNGRTFPPGDLAALIQCLMEVTDPDRIDLLKAASADVLTDWRHRADPVEGLRKALRSVGLLAKAHSI